MNEFTCHFQTHKNQTVAIPFCRKRNLSTTPRSRKNRERKPKHGKNIGSINDQPVLSNPENCRNGIQGKHNIGCCEQHNHNKNSCIIFFSVSTHRKFSVAVFRGSMAENVSENDILYFFPGRCHLLFLQRTWSVRYKSEWRQKYRAPRKTCLPVQCRQ